MTVSVTDRAEFIGSAVAEKLLQQVYNVIVLDNLQQVHGEAIPPGVGFIPGDIIGDRETLDQLCKSSSIDALMHMVGETVDSRKRLEMDEGTF